MAKVPSKRSSSTQTRTPKTAAKAPKKPAKAPKKVARKAPRKASAARRTAAPMFEKVAFTMFPITDPTRARHFYEEVLGLERGLASPSGSWTEYDLPGGGCLALFCHPKPEFAGKPGGAIALEVADLDTLNQRLKATGVVYRGDLVFGPNCRMSNIEDSEGNALILHQRNAKPRAGRTAKRK